MHQLHTIHNLQTPQTSLLKTSKRKKLIHLYTHLLTLMVVRLGWHNIQIIEIETRRIKCIIRNGVSCTQSRRPFCLFECATVDDGGCAVDVVDHVVVEDEDGNDEEEGEEWLRLQWFGSDEHWHFSSLLSMLLVIDDAVDDVVDVINVD